ncbi:MAG: metallophosphoesterase [Armatimonadota bacterium]|nr:metallophosphoesterase [Armatimonadota bacterium]
MKVGIMSDSHDHLENIRKAVEAFNSAKVRYVLHAGDFVAPFVANELQKLNCPLLGVFGNNDGERIGLQNRFKSFGAEVKVQPAFIELEGKKFVIIHEHDLSDALAESGKFDVVVYGHTHNLDIRKASNGCLIVNPGEVCGWLTGKSTVAILDTETMEVKLLDL